MNKWSAKYPNKNNSLVMEMLGKCGDEVEVTVSGGHVKKYINVCDVDDLVKMLLLWISYSPKIERIVLWQVYFTV